MNVLLGIQDGHSSLEYHRERDFFDLVATELERADRFHLTDHWRDLEQAIKAQIKELELLEAVEPNGNAFELIGGQVELLQRRTRSQSDGQ